MTTARNLPSAVRDSLTKLAESGDRTPPTVFAGREDEFALLDAAMRGTHAGDLGRTVVRKVRSALILDQADRP